MDILYPLAEIAECGVLHAAAPPLSVQQNSGGLLAPGWMPSPVGTRKLWVVLCATRAAQPAVAFAISNLNEGDEGMPTRVSNAAQMALTMLAFSTGSSLGVAHLVAGRRARLGCVEHGPDDFAAVGGGQNPECS